MTHKNDVVATPNVIESTKAAETASNNNIRNNIDMNNIIDFSSVCGEGIVAQTASVDQQVVNDMFNAFLSIPQEVIVKFKNENGYLKMVVYMNHREKFLRSYETFADAKLVEIMVGSMRGDKVGALQGYKSEEITQFYPKFVIISTISVFKQSLCRNRNISINHIISRSTVLLSTSSQPFSSSRASREAYSEEDSSRSAQGVMQSCSAAMPKASVSK